MGFLQYFSIRTRRSKKKQMGKDVLDAFEVPPVLDLRRQHEQQEETVNYLLRSSSAKFAIMREIDYASLPPIPHPIHRVLPTSTASTSCLPSVSQRGTYTVKVYPRTLHTRTEFPNANPGESITPKRSQHDSLRRRSKSVPITPRDKSRLYGLRQDPSVVSLLHLYDEHGCLNSKVFSNSPSSPDDDGFAQVRRNGSTLRQLLGGPSNVPSRHVRDTDAMEGDISWAERHLCESPDSSTSSLGVVTPNDAFFPDTPSIDAHNDQIHSNLYDTPTNKSDSFPAISSLEVELSRFEDFPSPKSHTPKSPYENDNCKTPQRASQVFGFLAAKKNQTQRHSQIAEERPLPTLSDSVQTPVSRFSSYSSSAGSHESDIPSSDDTHHNTEPHMHELESTARTSYNQASLTRPSASNWLEPPPSRRRNLAAASHSTLREGPSQQAILTSRHEAQSRHIPRSPRPLPPFPPNPAQPGLSERHQQPHHILNFPLQEPRRVFKQTDRSSIAAVISPALPVLNHVDVFTHIPSRLSHHRVPSRSSTALAQASMNYEQSVPDLTYVAPTTVKSVPKELKDRSLLHNKENDHEERLLYNAQRLPTTPIRSRSTFRAPGDATPSPASSSDLSPVAQQLMADLRTQRMHARERQKRIGRWGSTTSKLKQ